MNPPDKLADGLKKKNFLAADDSNFDTYAELEQSIVAHVFGSRQDDSAVARFDAECIENTADYTHLIRLFIEAVPADLNVSDIESNYDMQNATASCEITLGENREEAEWAQESDWVAPEFIDFMLRVTVCSKGRFVVIDTGDQTFCAIFLTKGLSDALEKYRKNSAGSREAFVGGHFEGNMAMYEHIKILPRQVFKAAEASLRQRFKNDQDLLDPDAYQTDEIGSFFSVSESNDALTCYRWAEDRGGTKYAVADIYNYGWICPDEAAYFLSLKDPGQEVVFEYPAKQVGALSGEGKSLGPYAVVGKSSDWAILVDRGSFICLGSVVVDQVSEGIRDARDNKVGQYYNKVSTELYEPLIAELGYSEIGDKFNHKTLLKHGKHWSSVKLSGSQPDLESDLNITVTFSVADPEIDHVARRKSLPEPSFDPDQDPAAMSVRKFGELNWDITNEADYDKLTDEFEDKLRELHREVSEEISTEQWLKIFRDNEDNMRVAVAAYFLGDTETMEKAIREQYEFEMGPDGFWFNRDQVKNLADLLGVKLE